MKNEWYVQRLGGEKAFRILGNCTRFRVMRTFGGEKQGRVAQDELGREDRDLTMNHLVCNAREIRFYAWGTGIFLIRKVTRLAFLECQVKMLFMGKIRMYLKKLKRLN